MPDPILAVLVDPAGTQGWAVGGSLDENERVETGNVERYQQNPAEAAPPTGEKEEAVPLKPAAGAPEETTFAFGGHAECAAPCGERALAGVGPQVWLSSAATLARKIGVQAFLYTGPSVTEGNISGPRSIAIPFAEELEDNAAILASSAPVPSYVVPPRRI